MNRLGELSNCFFPIFSTATNADADGSPVLPQLETAWFRLGEEGRKRIRHAYLSYDVRASATSPILGVDYIKTPQETTWLPAGNLPPSATYRRQRLPVGKQPYGIAFRVRQLVPSTVTRLFDLAVEESPSERSRL